MRNYLVTFTDYPRPVLVTAANRKEAQHEATLLLLRKGVHDMGRRDAIVRVPPLHVTAAHYAEVSEC